MCMCSFCIYGQNETNAKAQDKGKGKVVRGRTRGFAPGGDGRNTSVRQ